MKVYDVCNDYSLDLAAGKTAKPQGYVWHEQKIVTREGTFVDIEVGALPGDEDFDEDEIHYVVTESDINLNGLIL